MVDGWTDWTVSPAVVRRRADAHRHHRSRPADVVLHRSPAAPRSSARTARPTVWTHSGTRIGFTIRGHDYVAYAPTRRDLDTSAGTTITSTLAGKSYFTVAVLPTTAASTNARPDRPGRRLRPYAHAHVTGTSMYYSYDAASGDVPTTYGCTTTPREGTETRTVVSLYPHQWKALTDGTPIEPDLRLAARRHEEPRRGRLLHHQAEVPRHPARDPRRRHLDRRRQGHPDRLPQPGGRQPGGVRSIPTPTGPARAWVGPPGSRRSPTSWATAPFGTRH